MTPRTFILLLSISSSISASEFFDYFHRFYDSNKYSKRNIKKILKNVTETNEMNAKYVEYTLKKDTDLIDECLNKSDSMGNKESCYKAIPNLNHLIKMYRNYEPRLERKKNADLTECKELLSAMEDKVNKHSKALFEELGTSLTRNQLITRYLQSEYNTHRLHFLQEYNISMYPEALDNAHKLIMNLDSCLSGKDVDEKCQDVKETFMGLSRYVGPEYHDRYTFQETQEALTIAGDYPQSSGNAQKFDHDYQKAAGSVTKLIKERKEKYQLIIADEDEMTEKEHLLFTHHVRLMDIDEESYYFEKVPLPKINELIDCVKNRETYPLSQINKCQKRGWHNSRRCDAIAYRLRNTSETLKLHTSKRNMLSQKFKKMYDNIKSSQKLAYKIRDDRKNLVKEQK